MSKFLIFNDYKQTKKSEHATTEIVNKETREYLGKIFFYPLWKQFVFEPNPYSVVVFSNKCLLDIVLKIRLMNKEKW